MRILLTGASGFVGRGVVTAMSGRDDIQLGVAVRSRLDGLPSTVSQHLIPSIDHLTNWSDALEGREVVIHAAARVHVMKELSPDPMQEFRRVNVDGTVALARQAAKAGVRRFIFLSSVKVNGETTKPGRPFRADDSPTPTDPYAISKLEAEQALTDLAKSTGLEVVIVRPPLIYGPGVKANFLNLVRLVEIGLPLPFGRAVGLRSMIALDNLVDFLILSCAHPEATGGTYLVSDGLDLSLSDLVAHISKALGRRTMLLPVPPIFLNFLGRAVGREDVIQRLFGSLQVDAMPARQVLGWRPPVTPEEGIGATVSHFLRNRAHQ